VRETCMSHPRHYSDHHAKVEEVISQKLSTSPCAEHFAALQKCTSIHGDWTRCQEEVKALKKCELGLRKTSS